MIKTNSTLSPKPYTLDPTRSGFTLVEMLVAMSVFLTVFSIAVGGFVSAMRTQRQLQALISANSNVSLVVEQMAREIRTGTIFEDLPGECAAPELNCSLRFLNVRNQVVVYAWDKTNLTITRSVAGGQALPMTADNVAVASLGFSVVGRECSATHQPRVMISLGVRPRDEKGVDQVLTELQTSISSRQGAECIILVGI